MREIIEMLKVIESGSNNIDIAKGKFEYTGRVFKDTIKIIKNLN